VGLVKALKSEENSWTTCSECQGRGKKSKRLRKKVRLQYQRALEAFEQSAGEGAAPVRPKAHLDTCPGCDGSGLVLFDAKALADRELDQHSGNNKALAKDYPRIAIIGGGIGGVALAVACLHRGIPFTLYERDSGFEARSQGYGLTLQQASRAIEGLGIFSLAAGVVSTKHVVHTPDGKVIGEWGIRKWGASDTKAAPKRTNVHIARQLLRLALLEQLGGHDKVQWGHQLVDFKDDGDKGVELSFLVDDSNKGKAEVKIAHADLVVGADGIRSSMRRLLIGEDVSPLRYLGCIVILGICPLAELEANALLDSATVFQTANGNERIYMMPYTADSVMWQLSFPMDEDEAKALSAQGTQALKAEALRRCQWHEPIPKIIAATQEIQVSGYPVYDRAQLEPELLAQEPRITLIGDAAHPMSPFKGQGANQALLDALALARGIVQGCRPMSQWREAGIRDSVLTEFEAEMLQRSAKKVKESAEAAAFLHSDVVLHEGDEPRGRCIKRD
jgi:salicylate hydroxylase